MDPMDPPLDPPLTHMMLHQSSHSSSSPRRRKICHCRMVYLQVGRFNIGPNVLINGTLCWSVALLLKPNTLKCKVLSYLI